MEEAAEVYPEAKAIEAKRNDPAGHYVYRPISRWLTRPAVMLRTSPTGITFAAGIVALVAFGALAGGAIASGLALIHLARLLDALDGNVARARRMTSPRGAWLDTIVGTSVNTFFLAFLGWGIAIRGAHAPSLLAAPLNGELELRAWAGVVGVCGSFLIVLRKWTLSGVAEVRQPDETFRAELADRAGLWSVPKFVNSFTHVFLTLAALAGLYGTGILLYGLWHLLLASGSFVIGWRRLESPRPSEL